MAELRVDQRVRLMNDIPELELRSGCEGVLCSKWFAPQAAYEVEFEIPGMFFKTRALVLAEQIQSVETVTDELQLAS
jgi:hypothetical protein